jgi:hypothetical protein
MKVQTTRILEATLKSDETIAPAKRNAILRFARDGEAEPVQNIHTPEPVIFSRAAAAKMVGDKTVRYIDLLAKRGLLQKHTPPGNQRSIGITGESLRAFIQGT